MLVYEYAKKLRYLNLLYRNIIERGVIIKSDEFLFWMKQYIVSFGDVKWSFVGFEPVHSSLIHDS